MHACMHECVLDVHMHAMCMQVPTEDRRGPWILEAGATDSHEPPDKGARNQTWIFWKGGKCS